METNEGVVYNLGERLWDSEVVHGVWCRLDVKHDLDGGMSGTEFKPGHFETNDHGEGGRVAEDVVPPVRFVSCGCDAGWSASLFTPGVSNGSKIRPVQRLQHVVKGGNVHRVCIDVPKNDGGTRGPGMVVRETSSNDPAGLLRILFHKVAPRATINIVDMKQTSSFAFAPALPKL